MIYIWFLIWVCFNSSNAQQFYDSTECSSQTNNPGTRYTCNSSQKSCQTYLVYRASPRFPTVSNISGLFSVDPDELLPLNNLTSASEFLKPGREVLVPITCSCAGQFFQANFSYLVPESTTFTEIACGIFEGLLKSVTLLDENLPHENNPMVGSVLHVPLKCACPDNFTSTFLVTYPFVEGDGTDILALKFGVPSEKIWEANQIERFTTVYPNTTVLVPVNGKPFINLNIANSDPPLPGFLPTFPIKPSTKTTQLKKIYIAGSVVGFSLVLLLLAFGLYVRKALNKWQIDHIQSSARRSSLTSFSTPRSSPVSGTPITRSSNNSCLSPDLLIGIKYSLCNYSIEELKKATNEFSDDTKISGLLYKGLIENVLVMIRHMRFEDTRMVIDVHSKINHVNIVKLLGVCYGENDFSSSYLVFEYPANGCLRDCLTNSPSSLRWHRRTQIAFDIVKGLHYLHYCMVPPYTLMNVNSRNIFLSPSWRAKLAVFGITPTGENDCGVEPVHLVVGLASEKVDIFAFGVVLLELISAREDVDGNLVREAIRFLGGGASELGGCFDQLRNFVDPGLKEDYPLAEALCLAVLAKACVEDDPMHRPCVDDIMKVLARMV
ncbi:lysM domain receptor-like kinase 4 [Actinidia eriantha]|uniref:lysM domain receptor-like kinase 4 n=1 Tax=Actinidia eriantha TaxID=165200 RepID=UPI00258CFCFF|nr:lysM domain receptor-like kinase 4 [Actinidia eriantha]